MESTPKRPQVSLRFLHVWVRLGCSQEAGSCQIDPGSGTASSSALASELQDVVDLVDGERQVGEPSDGTL